MRGFRPKKTMKMAKFNKGDKVSALNDAIDGVVLSVHGTQVRIETTEGFEMVFDEKELISVSSGMDIKMGNLSQILKDKEIPKPRSFVREKKTGDVPPPEFDLHIEKLVKNPRILSHHDILTLQSDTARRHVDFAIRNRIPKIILIHGVGEGILKSELEFLLSRYDNLTFREASFQKYGVGAMEVTFRHG